MELIILGALVAVAAWVALTFNRLVRLRVEAGNAYANIDVQLKRRADLIPNLVEAVQGYATHERTTFEQVTRARSHVQGASSQRDLEQADAETEQGIGRLLAVAEAYPELQASQNFLDLQEELARAEDLIAAARRYHNNVVRRINTLVGTFPPLLVARAFGFSEHEYFRIEADSERSPVQVRLQRGGSEA